MNSVMSVCIQQLNKIASMVGRCAVTRTSIRQFDTWMAAFVLSTAHAYNNVVILLFQPQGRSDMVLAASPWQDRSPGILFQHRCAAAILHPRSVVIWKLNCLSERITSTLVMFLAVRVGEHNFSTHHHHQWQLIAPGSSTNNFKRSSFKRAVHEHHH